MRRERLDRWMREHPVAMDGLLAVALLVFPGLVTLNSGIAGPRHLAVTTLLLTLPLAWRRRRPTLSTSVIFATAFVHFVAGSGLLPSDLTVFIALYSVAAYAGRVPARLGLVFALVGAALVAIRQGVSSPGLSFLAGAAFLTVLGSGFSLAVWGAGTLRGTRRAYLDAVVERAHRLEIEREQQSRLAAAAERARIARELHDVVAHSLSVIIAQADGGRYAARADPASAVDALEVVAATGRSALTDMRRLLGVLRDGDPGRRDPQPGIDGIEELAESVRASGLPVTLDQQGTARPVGAGFGLTAYRIVQEALTNVLKHGGPAARATVRLGWEPDAVRLVVEDDGRGASARHDGHGQGLSGMRERASLYGGSLEAGPRPGGGFRVHALLPFPPPDPRPRRTAPDGTQEPSGATQAPDGTQEPNGTKGPPAEVNPR